jgi:hypothetical protein
VSDYTCTFPGCIRNPRDGYAIYRTSPKGEPFAGRCEEHFERADPDLVDFVSIIEDENMKKREKQT